MALMEKHLQLFSGMKELVKELFDIKDSIPDNVVTDIILLPYTLPTSIVVNTVEAVLTGDVEVIVDGVEIIGSLQKENYVEALSTAFKLANFQDGQSLADAVLAVERDYVTLFYESLNLIEGGRDLADAFKYLIEFDLQKFVTSMINAAPLLLKVLI